MDLLPDIPVGDQYRISVGVQHDFGEGKELGLSYTFLYQDAELDRVTLPPSGAVTLDGDYDNSFVHLVGLTLSLSFGKPQRAILEND